MPRTIKAGPEFDETLEQYMLQVGVLGGCNKSSGRASNKDCNSDIGLQHLTLDGQGRAWGALNVADTMDVDVGHTPKLYKLQPALNSDFQAGQRAVAVCGRVQGGVAMHFLMIKRAHQHACAPESGLKM